MNKDVKICGNFDRSGGSALAESDGSDSNKEKR